jgi:hypothetical protein
MKTTSSPKFKINENPIDETNSDDDDLEEDDELLAEELLVTYEMVQNMENDLYSDIEVRLRDSDKTIDFFEKSTKKLNTLR